MTQKIADQVAAQRKQLESWREERAPVLREKARLIRLETLELDNKELEEENEELKEKIATLERKNARLDAGLLELNKTVAFYRERADTEAALRHTLSSKIRDLL